MQIISLLIILFAINVWAGMTSGDVQSQKEALFYKKCTHAKEIVLVATVRSKFNKSKAGEIKCLGKSSLNLKDPCYVVEKSKCIQGKCKSIFKGYDLRKLGVDLTSDWYLDQSPIYLIWNNNNQFEWQDTIWMIDEKSIVHLCK